MVCPKTIDVATGEIVVSKSGDILRSSAIGSCVVVCAYCRQKRVGGLAHIMLPGYCPHDRIIDKTNYAENAIEELLCQMNRFQADMEHLDVCLVGAANVLKRPEDTVAYHNIDSVTDILRKKRINVQAQSVGGTNRRSATLDTAKGCVLFTEGDGATKLLWTVES
ncbi:MAG: chemotaxis protein CheD [Candidatus Omnitrophica bacterium]|nr:chemotaxis protein CheD [Candidatus Omnitrophota bacterium]